MWPESLLCLRSSVNRWDAFFSTTFGIDPVSLFSCRCTYLKEEELMRQEGILPERWFCEKSKNVISDELQNSTGIGPSKELSRMVSIFSEPNLAIQVGI